MQRLPLTLFERFLLHDDRRAFPCWILVRYRFAGSFQREILGRAWEQVSRRHPLLTAIVRKNWRGRLFWEPAPDFKPAIDWRQGGRTDWPQWTPIDLGKAPGFNLIALEGDGRTDLFVQAHHAVSDGAGVFAVVDDLLVHYARSLGEGVESAPLRPEQLPDRNRFGLSLGDKLKLIPSMAIGLMISVQAHWRKIVPLLPHRPVPDADAPPPEMPRMASRRFSPEEFAQLRASAKRLGIGLHDLFIGSSQAALGVWLKDQGAAQRLDWVRVAAPIHLRRPADIQLPAANVVSLVGVDRQMKSLANRDRLLRRVREDMRLVKKLRLGYLFIVMLGLFRFIPGGIRLYARHRVCRATLLMTNLGQNFHASPLLDAQGKLAVPGAILEDVCLAAPLRPGLGAGIAFGVYAGGLWADLHYDSRIMTPAQGDSLVQAVAEQIRLTMG